MVGFYHFLFPGGSEFLFNGMKPRTSYPLRRSFVNGKRTCLSQRHIKRHHHGKSGHGAHGRKVRIFIQL
jgi:hypothetical protein